MAPIHDCFEEECGEPCMSTQELFLLLLSKTNMWDTTVVSQVMILFGLGCGRTVVLYLFCVRLSTGLSVKFLHTPDGRIQVVSTIQIQV